MCWMSMGTGGARGCQGCKIVTRHGSVCKTFTSVHSKASMHAHLHSIYLGYVCVERLHKRSL